MIRVTNPTVEFLNMAKACGILIDGSEVFDGQRLTRIDVDVTEDLLHESKTKTADQLIDYWILWKGFGDRFNGERFTVLSEVEAV